jgi:HemY protein
MWRALFYFVVIVAATLALVWFADRPGEITIAWLDYEIETSLLVAISVLALAFAVLWLGWSMISGILGAPGAIADFFKLRRRKHGFEALTRGMLAAGAGDAALAQKHAAQAGRWLAGEPLTLLLKAQAAQLKGDEAGAERLFRSMLQSPETELLGLHGLFVQARRNKDGASVKALAEQAFGRKPGLAWAARAVLMTQSLEKDWHAAERTLALCREHKLVDRAEADRKRAVLLCAQAMEREQRDDNKALVLAQQAHRLAPDLVPAAAIAGRILAAQGHAVRAARILAKTWRLAPHPDLAEIYGAARAGDSPRDRLKRVRMLLRKSDGGEEGSFALARAAVDARDWRAARSAIAPLLGAQQTARVCTLMAEIEDGEFGDKGKVREWLARAVSAPRDPAWTADGFVSEIWLPVSPVTGELDRFEWKVPLEALPGAVRPKFAAIPAADGPLPGREIAAPETGDRAETGNEIAKTDDSDGETAQAGKRPPAAPVAKDDPPADLSTGKQAKPKPAAPAEAEDQDQADPVIFVAPPAPDDPGPDTAKRKPGGWLSGLFS